MTENISYKILFIEDSQEDRELIKIYLKKLDSSSFEFTEAETWERAQVFLTDNEYDCIILDYLLPDLNGIEVLKNLKKYPKNSKTPAVLLTGQGTEEIAVSSMKHGAADYLIKGKASAKNIQDAIFNSIIKNQLEKRIHKEETRVKQLQKELFLSSKLASIGELSSGVAHEIKNPLAILYGEVELLKEVVKERDINDDQINEHLNQQELCVKRISKIVDNLNSYCQARTETSDKFDIHTALSHTVSIIEDLYKNEFKIEISRNYSAANSIVEGNLARVQQVFLSIITNAKDSMAGNGGTIKLDTCNNSKNECIISITDTGKGIKSHHLSKIFDPFFTTKEVGEGPGLGLSTAYNIIKAMKGHIVVSSKVNLGTTVVVKIPTAYV